MISPVQFDSMLNLAANQAHQTDTTTRPCQSRAEPTKQGRFPAASQSLTQPGWSRSVCVALAERLTGRAGRGGVAVTSSDLVLRAE